MAQLPAARAAQHVLNMESRGVSPHEFKSCMGKRSYLTRRGARSSARQLHGSGRGKLSPYKCPHCELFHLTKAENNHRRRGV